MKEFVTLLLILLWAAGVVAAKGFWMTLISFVIFPIGWIMGVQLILTHWGVLT